MTILAMGNALAVRAADIGRIGRALGTWLVVERERWILWVPVLLGFGATWYFSLPSEPAAWFGPAAAGLALGAAVVAARDDNRALLRTVAFAVLSVCIGFAAAQIRTLGIAPHTLLERVGPVALSGRVVEVESYGDGHRLTIDRVRIAEFPADRTPDRVRIRLRGTQPSVYPGDVVRVRAVLSPPPEPVVPGGYDFQRQAFFQNLDAVGFSVGTASVVPGGVSDRDGAPLWFERLRFTVAETVLHDVPGASGAVSLALLTGETQAIPQPVMAAIRDSGLAHLLSISGLHIGLVAGIVLFAARAVLALIPSVALRYPIKKWAAVLSVVVATAYVMLADAPVPAQRSLLMVAVVLLAVLVDRHGISMRLVACAAAFILVTQPEEMLGPSFQMSFAAVVALIASYEVVRERRLAGTWSQSPAGRLGLYLGGIMLSSLVAGLATAPYAAFHFGRFTVYGVFANMVAVPVTGIWVMPWAVVAMIVMPFGLAHWALVPMAWGVDIIIWVAREVASWPGAVVQLPPLPPWGLAAFTLGGLWLCLWCRVWRLAGVAVIALGVIAFVTSSQPDVLVDGTGRLIAVRDTEGRLLFSSMTTARTTRQSWLARYGDDMAGAGWPPAGEGRDRLRCDNWGCIYRIGPRTVAIARQGEALIEDCRRSDVLVSLVPVPSSCVPAEAVIGRFDLWRNGTHALWLGGTRVRIESVAEWRGDRPWVLKSGAAKRQRSFRAASTPDAGTQAAADKSEEEDSPGASSDAAGPRDDPEP